jgi:hypothetical protein
MIELILLSVYFVTLRKEHRLRVNEHRLLRGIFGPKRGEVEK